MEMKTGNEGINKNHKVKKAIIPAGGLGSRFLPASAAIPKEIFPVFDKPLIYFAIEELKEAGVEEIYLVISPWKVPFFESFLNLKERYSRLIADPSKKSVLDKISFLSEWPKITLVIQNEAKGLAEAVGLCKDQIRDDAFFVLLPDEVFVSNHVNPSLSLLKTYQQFEKSTVGLFEIPHEDVGNYGVAKLGLSLGDHSNSVRNLNQISKDPSAPMTYQLNGLVEKPKPEDAPSDFMLPGRYLFTQKFWTAIEEELQQIQNLKLNQELHITNALDRMATDQMLLGQVVQGQRFDVGRPEGLLNLSHHIFNEI